MIDDILTGLIFPGRPPVTWGEQGELNRKILQKLMELNRKIDEKGYHLLVGSEQEFQLHPKHGVAQPDLQQKRQEALLTLYHATPVQELESAAFHAKADAISRFSLSDIMLFEMHEELGDILQYKFGPSRAGDGYYDVHGVMEVDLKPATPLQSITNYRRFLKRLEEKAEEFGLNIDYWTWNINISVNEGERNLLDFSSHAPDSRVVDITRHTLQAVNDALPCNIRPHTLNNLLQGGEISAGPERIDDLRVRGGTKNDGVLEMRINQNPRSGGHFAMSLLSMVTGVCSALGPQDHCNIPANEMSVHLKRRYSTPNKQMFFITELLNAADIQQDGEVVFNHDNARQVMKYLSYLADETGYALPDDLNPLVEASKLRTEIRLQAKGDKVEPVPNTLLDTPAMREKLARIHREPAIWTVSHTGIPVPSTEQCLQRMQGSKLLSHAWGEELHRSIVKACAGKYELPVPVLTKTPAHAV